MSKADIIALVASYVYAFGLLVVVEKGGLLLKWPQFLTRKLIHIGAGMWIWGILWLFEKWYFGIIPFATFILLNYYFYRKETFKTMDSTDSTPGTVYFAISITVLFLLFWRTGGPVDRVPIAAAAVMCMTWGDAMASLIGRYFGRKTYSVFGNNKTYLGSLAMLIAGFIAMAVTLAVLPGSALSPFSSVIAPGAIFTVALIAAIAATLAEAWSPAGTDNLSVPLVSAAVLWLFFNLV